MNYVWNTRIKDMRQIVENNSVVNAQGAIYTECVLKVQM